MKKETIRDILFWIAVIGISIALNSCSSKKKTTETHKEEVKMEHSENSEKSENSSLNVELDIVTKVDDKTKTTTTKKTATPIDPTKPASVVGSDGKKHELNNASLTEEITTEEKNKQTNISDTSEIVQKKETAVKAESIESTSAKNTDIKADLDKSGFNFWSWLWVAGVIIIGIGLLYLNNRFKLLKRVTAFFK